MTTSSSSCIIHLQSTIIRTPLMVASTMRVQDAIARMSEAHSSYVLIVEEDRASGEMDLIGILTERDLIRINLQPVPLEALSVGAVMTHPVRTLKESELTDIALVLNLFQQHQIRHLPVLDDGDRVVGLLERGNLTEVLAQQLLQVGSEAEVLPESTPIHASAIDTAIAPQSHLTVSHESVQSSGDRQGNADIDTHSDIDTSNSSSATESILRQYERVFATATDGIALIDRNYIYQLVNPVYIKRYGKRLDEVIGHSVEELHGETVFQTVTRHLIDRCLTGEVVRCQRWFEYENGTRQFITANFDPFFDVDGSVTGAVVTTHDLTATKQIEIWLATQNAILERIAKAEPLPDTLNALMQAMELQLEDAICSVMLCAADGMLYPGGSLQLSEAYLQAITGIPVGEGVGSCGTAAFRGESVIVSDIASDPLWQDFKTIALANDLRACWSVPLTASDDRLLGTFAVYHRTIYSPTEAEQSVVAMAANISSIAIEQAQVMQALKQVNQELEHRVEERTAALHASEERWQLVLKGTNAGIWDWDLRTNKMFFSSRWKQMRGFADDDIGDSPDECISRIHPDDCDRVMAMLADHFAGRTEFFEVEYRTQCQDGSYLWVLDRAQALRNQSGEVIRVSGSATDITDRKYAEQSLAQYAREVEDLYNYAPCGYHSLDRDGRYIRVNETELQWLGYSREEMIGKPLITFLTDAGREAFFKSYQVFQAQGWVKNLEYDMIRKDGSLLPVLISATAVKDEAGNYLYNRATLIDIRDRKQAELALKESQHFIQKIADASPNILYLYDLQEDRNIYVNHEIAVVLGYTPEEVQAMGSNLFSNLVHPDDLIRLPDHYARIYAAQDGEILEFEYRMRHANGEWRWLNSRDSVFSRDANGRAKQTIGTAQDISDRKRIESELIENEAKFRNLVEGSNNLIWFCDLNGVMTYLSPQFLSLFGWEPGEWLGQPFSKLVHPDDMDVIAADMGELVATGKKTNGHPFRHLRQDGSYRWVLTTAIVVKDLEGRPIGIQGILQDISGMKQTEAQLQAMNEQLAVSNLELARATRLKDEFLATMSHELRTPLNAILGMTEGLQDEIFGIVNERQLKALKTIERSGNHLLELINDILDVAKIEAGQIELNYTLTSIEHLCQSSLAFIKQQALQKNIQLAVQQQLPLPELFVDERRIRQVLINLLNNAVKFTPDGGTITLAVESQTDHDMTLSPWVQFSVTDTGIGIAAESMHKLFQPFVQIDGALNRQYTGTGLGLALVKRMVELHGGRVGLTSEVGVGSCFTIQLPCAPSSLLPTATPPVAESANPTPQPDSLPSEDADQSTFLILLAEDNEANIHTFSNYLGAKGYRLLFARNGEEAIALTTTHQPDLILMDIQMPGIDGLEAIQTIRHDPQLAHIPIIALTALAMEGDRQKCLQAGATEYLAKPIRLKELTQVMQTLLRESHPRS